MFTFDDCSRHLRTALDADAPGILGCLDMNEAMANHVVTVVPDSDRALAEILLSSPSLGQEENPTDTSATALELISEAITQRLFEEGRDWINNQLARHEDDVARICNEAAELVKRGYRKGGTAHDRDGKPVPTMHPAACAWCLSAALHRAAHTLELEKPDAEPLELALVARNVVALEIERRYPETSDQACRAELTAEPLPWTWNDLEAVDQGMVVVVLRGAHRSRVLRAWKAANGEGTA